MTDSAIYFVSDTHLGDGSGADRFRYPRQLLSLLNQIEAEPNARLVLLGDFMELWAARLEAVMVHYAPILSAIGRLAQTHPVTYVVGNHDCLPWYYFLGAGAGNVEVTEVFTAERGALVALHGHQFDRFNQVKELADGTIKTPWTRRLLEVVGFLGRVGGEAASDAIYDLGDHLEKAAASLGEALPDWDDLTRENIRSVLMQLKSLAERQSPGERGYPPDESEYEAGAGEWLRRGARYVVMGHTHHPLIRTYGRKAYFNSGSWVSDHYPPTYVRYSGGQLQLLHGETHQPYTPPSQIAQREPPG